MFYRPVTTAGVLAAMIRELRENASLTQQQLADKARVSRAWVAKLESGHHRHPDIDAVFAVMRALHVRFVAEDVPLEEQTSFLAAHRANRRQARDARQ